MSSEHRIEHPDLRLLNVDSRSIESCEVRTHTVDGRFTVHVSAQNGPAFEVASSIDFEEALTDLRTQLEAAGLLLLCNRFRRNAFVSGMSRGMSGGLACYLVVAGQGVEPERVVPCLGPAPADAVTTAKEADAHLSAWIAKGPTRWWLIRLRLKHEWRKRYPGAKYS